MNLKALFWGGLWSGLSLFSHTIVHAQTTKELNKITFLIPYFNTSDYFYEDLFSGINRLKNENKVKEVSILSTDDNIEKEKELFEKALRDSDAILMIDVPGGPIQEYAEKTKRLNKPLVFMMRHPKSSILNSYDHVYSVSSDNVSSGISQGLLISEYIQRNPKTDKNQDGIINILMVGGGAQDDPSTVKRMEWFKNTINNYPGSQVQGEISEWIVSFYAQEKAIEEMRKLIESGRIEKVEAIIAETDSLAEGAYIALKEKNLQIPTFGRGAYPVGLKMIQEGTMEGTISSPFRNVGYYSALIAYNVATQSPLNEGIPNLIYKSKLDLPYKVITRKNLHEANN